MDPDSSTARVARGVAWLDANQPGWHRRINLEVLDMGSCDHCILGQLFGEFSMGVRRLVGSAEPLPTPHSIAVDHGFDGFAHILREKTQPLWIKEIERRRAPVADPAPAEPEPELVTV